MGEYASDILDGRSANRCVNRPGWRKLLPGPSIFSALEEQLGSRLESRKGLLNVLVVDSANKVQAETKECDGARPERPDASVFTDPSGSVLGILDLSCLAPIKGNPIIRDGKSATPVSITDLPFGTDLRIRSHAEENFLKCAVPTNDCARVVLCHSLVLSPG